jgi:hypothetical protein
MIKLIAALVAIAAALASPVMAGELSGDYLYKVTSVRAAPGKLAALLDYYAALKASGYYQKASARPPLIMRHSQGDHWDLLVVSPMEGWFDYYSPRRGELRAKADDAAKDILGRRADLVAFSEDVFAYGPDIKDVAGAFDANGFFHIEMFNAAPGKGGDLFRQRERENAYLAATGQVENMIFWVEAGGDVDVFTIGFHPSLEAFAAPSPASDDEKEAAAKAAGFKDRADISFYLRSLISGHHDTLATKVD